MAKKKSTGEIIQSWPEWKQEGFNTCWTFQWRVGSNKRQAAEAWGNWVTSEAICNRVIHGAREYTSSYKNNPYIKGMAPWINQEGWLDDHITVKKDVEEVVLNVCMCGETATILQPKPLCSRCWSKEYGTIRYEGKSYRANEFLVTNLKKMDMMQKDGESWGEYTERCRNYVLDKAKSVGVDKGKRV